MAFRPTVPHRPEPPAKPQPAKELRETVGHLCEVRKPNNTLVFLGRVKSYDGASLCIHALYPTGPRGKDEYFSRVGKVVDVRRGGVQLRGPDFYRPGDHLLLTNLYLDKARPFVFTLHVRWAAQVSPVEAHLGCSFENMTVRDEDRLCAAILELQRQDIARQRDF